VKLSEAARPQTVVVAFFPKGADKGLNDSMEAYRDQYATLLQQWERKVVVPRHQHRRGHHPSANWGAANPAFQNLFASDPNQGGRQAVRIGGTAAMDNTKTCSSSARMGHIVYRVMKIRRAVAARIRGAREGSLQSTLKSPGASHEH